MIACRSCLSLAIVGGPEGPFCAACGSRAGTVDANDSVACLTIVQALPYHPAGATDANGGPLPEVKGDVHRPFILPGQAESKCGQCGKEPDDPVHQLNRPEVSHGA